MRCLAFDLGAESGRAMLGEYAGGRLTVSEIHRFPNQPVSYNGHLHWDVPRLWLEMKSALTAVAGIGRGESASVGGGEVAGIGRGELASIGVDTWGLDYALLGEDGALLENPYHYRDCRTDGLVDRVVSLVPAEYIYGQTGCQFMQINTLYQLYASALGTPGLLSAAKHLVTIPDLFNFWLTGEIRCELTNATTTQFCNITTRRWAGELLDKLNIPTHFLTDLIEPGTAVGHLRADAQRECGLTGISVIAPACHDTGSAVAAIPLTPSTAYISSGTWSLLGAEMTGPVLTEAARAANFTNEGGVCGTVRLLKNITGMWLLQCCRREWRSEGRDLEYADLMQAAQSSPPFRSLVDPDHPDFLHTDRMTQAIANFCRRTGQPAPGGPREVTRSILESLALKYEIVLEALEHVSGRRYDEIRIVGGGALNGVLNQFTADATGRRVEAGPVEATALGNLLMQLLATGAVASLAEGRKLIDESFPSSAYFPGERSAWERALERFRQYCSIR